MTKINVEKCAKILSEKDDILILMHAHPDGDTLGSGFGLCRALLKAGKRARAICADEIPEKYNFLFSDTIADNIRYGEPTADMDRVRQSACVARADEFIEKYSARLERLTEEDKNA